MTGFVNSGEHTYKSEAINILIMIIGLCKFHYSVPLRKAFLLFSSKSFPSLSFSKIQPFSLKNL